MILSTWFQTPPPPFLPWYALPVTSQNASPETTLKDRTFSRIFSAPKPWYTDRNTTSHLKRRVTAINLHGEIRRPRNNPIANSRSHVDPPDPSAGSEPDRSAGAPSPPAGKPANTAKAMDHRPPAFADYLKEPIWLVERRGDTEFYSNRLQIITSATVKNIPRSYFRFPKDRGKAPDEAMPTNAVAGLLYHTSESDLFPLLPEMNQSIKKYSRWLVRYTGKNHSYHYLIDRFGRVFRIVHEDHVAFHAGNAVWADRDWLYLNLNHAFLGICFEGRDYDRNTPAKGGKKNREMPNLSLSKGATLNEAQLKSGRELSDWLRVKYRIPQQNCVTHGLASVNPRKRLIGYHLDLSTGFPFKRFRLSDKNLEALPAITEFGFSYDNYFLKVFDGKLWPGIHLSEAILRKRAQEARLPLHGYRKLLVGKFRVLFDWQKNRQEMQAQDKVQKQAASLQAALPLPSAKLSPDGHRRTPTNNMITRP